MAFIEFKNIYLMYEDKVLFQDFSMIIEKGDKILITGKSGAGKSSLIKMLLGFSNYNKGSIKINDKELKDSDFSDIRSLYAYVNQDVTIRQGNVMKFLMNLESYKHNTFKMEGDYGLRDDLMKLFEFDKSLLYKESQELSGGERQRLGIIIAIMLNKPVFLLDEITSGLDYELKGKVANYFAKCNETVISISHDLVWKETGKFIKVGW